MVQQEFDMIVVGGGPAGYGASLRASELGFSVACIEEDNVGGTCLNRGCIPSKLLLNRAEITQKIKKTPSLGLTLTGSLGLTTLMDEKETCIRALGQGLSSLMDAKKITRINGHAIAKNARTVDISSDENTFSIHAKKAIVLATGSKPFVPPTIALTERILTSDHLLSLTEVPQKLIIVGGGYIGLELGLFWSRMGSEVTILEGQKRLLPMFDPDVVRPLEDALTKEGITVHLNTLMNDIRETSDSVIVKTTCENDTSQLEANCVALALGRRPRLDSATVQNLSLALDNRGTVLVNEHFQTSCSGVYAIGDLVRGPMLAHKAEREGIVLAEHLAGQSSQIYEALIPSVIYTDPQIAAVGFTEQELKERNVPLIKSKATFSANGRAQASGEGRGFLKMIAHKETKRILGVQIVGPAAETLIGEAVLGMTLSASAEDFANTIHAHPTLSEVYGESARKILDL